MVKNQIEAWVGGMVLMAWHNWLGECGEPVPIQCDMHGPLEWFECDWLNGVSPLGWQWKED